MIERMACRLGHHKHAAVSTIGGRHYSECLYCGVAMVRRRTGWAMLKPGEMPDLQLMQPLPDLPGGWSDEPWPDVPPPGSPASPLPDLETLDFEPPPPLPSVPVRPILLDDEAPVDPVDAPAEDIAAEIAPEAGIPFGQVALDPEPQAAMEPEPMPIGAPAPPIEPEPAPDSYPAPEAPSALVVVAPPPFRPSHTDWARIATAPPAPPPAPASPAGRSEAENAAVAVVSLHGDKAAAYVRMRIALSRLSKDADLIAYWEAVGQALSSDV